MATRKKPVKKAPSFLYRFYACGPSGDEATLMGLVEARSDDEAMEKGFALYPASVIEAYNKEWGVPDDLDDDDGAFYTCEDVDERLNYAQTDLTLPDAVEDAEYFLGSLPAFAHLPDVVLQHMAKGLVAGYREYRQGSGYTP